MASRSVNNDNLNHWRDYFRTSNSDIFVIIEQAISVAALDCPKEFRKRRGSIAEVLFSCKLLRCFGCDRVELNVGKVNVNDGDYDYEGVNEGFKNKEGGFDDKGGVGNKGSNVNSISRDDNGDVGKEINENMISVPKSNFSYGDAEALTDEIEAQGEIVGEVLRIKEILQNSQDESDSVLFDSLRRLQLMALTFDILKATEIGKAVNVIRRHSSKQIRLLARSLIDGWKVIVNEWVKATQELAEGGTPESVNPSTVEEADEGGLPSPPLDEGAFLTTQTMELSQFFEGMDDDGNPRNCGESNENHEVRRKPSAVKQATTLPKDNKVQQMKWLEPIIKPNRPSNTQSGPGRPVKPNGELKGLKDSQVQQKLEKPVVHRHPAHQAEYQKLSSNEDAVQEKLKATKQKLQERYLQAENAKRQRTIQVMELHDLPKQGAVNKSTQGKFGNHNRHRANGRR